MHLTLAVCLQRTHSRKYSGAVPACTAAQGAARLAKHCTAESAEQMHGTALHSAYYLALGAAGALLRCQRLPSASHVPKRRPSCAATRVHAIYACSVACHSEQRRACTAGNCHLATRQTQAHGRLSSGVQAPGDGEGHVHSSKERPSGLHHAR